MPKWFSRQLTCLSIHLGPPFIRAVIEEIDWEAVNDDNDPNHFNWDYYNKVFSNARFQGVWNTLRYLNQKGITDGLMISFMGAAPASPPLEEPDPQKSWMGGTDHTISSKQWKTNCRVDGSIPILYAAILQKIQFTLVSPMNETDIQVNSKSAEHPDGVVEGPNIPDAIQYVRVVRKLARKTRCHRNERYQIRGSGCRRRTLCLGIAWMKW